MVGALYRPLSTTVSIHAPARGATPTSWSVARPALRPCVSIHAPRAGSDNTKAYEITVAAMDLIGCFYPRSRARRACRDRRSCDKPLRPVSITHPARGRQLKRHCAKS